MFPYSSVSWELLEVRSRRRGSSFQLQDCQAYEELPLSMQIRWYINLWKRYTLRVFETVITIQYGKDEQAHKDVMLQLINCNTKKDLFADPEDTITLQDLDDDFLNAEVDNL